MSETVAVPDTQRGAVVAEVEAVFPCKGVFCWPETQTPLKKESSSEVLKNLTSSRTVAGWMVYGWLFSMASCVDR